METRRNRGFGGVILLALGLYFLLNQFFDFPLLNSLGSYILLVLGVVFLVWGAVTRKPGLMIPGGILSGLGLGVVLVSGQFAFLQGDTTGAVFMFAFAFGWLLITVFTAVFTDETQWWPLIPGAIMAAVGLFTLFQGRFPALGQWMSWLWPLLLIGLGIYVLLRAQGEKGPDVDVLDSEDVNALKKKQA